MGGEEGVDHPRCKGRRLTVMSMKDAALHQTKGAAFCKKKKSAGGKPTSQGTGNKPAFCGPDAGFLDSTRNAVNALRGN